MDTTSSGDSGDRDDSQAHLAAENYHDKVIGSTRPSRDGHETRYASLSSSAFEVDTPGHDGAPEFIILRRAFGIEALSFNQGKLGPAGQLLRCVVRVEVKHAVSDTGADSQSCRL